MKESYFPQKPWDPPPLSLVVHRRVRFEEVDSLGIVWHGRYSSYFEDARAALGESYDIGYLDFYRNGVLAPIKKMHTDYHQPLRLQEKFTIEGILHWSEAARINYSFIIRNEQNQVATTGYTVQLILDLDYRLLMVLPPFFVEFQKKWKKNLLKPKQSL